MTTVGDIDAGTFTKAVFEQAGTGLAIIDATGVVVASNHAMAQLHGLDVGWLEGEAVTTLHEPGDDPYQDPGAAALLDDPTATHTFERAVGGRRVRYRIARLSDEPLRFLLEACAAAATPSSNGDGAAAGALEVPAQLVRAAPDPLDTVTVPQVALSADGRIVVANEAFATLVGVRRAELANTPLSALDDGGAVEVGEQIAAVAGGSVTSADGELRVRVDGRSTRIIRLDLACRPSLNGHPEPPSPTVIATATDVTAQRRDDQLLADLFERSPTPHVMLALDGEIVGANPAWNRIVAEPAGGRLSGALDDGWQFEEALAGIRSGHEARFSLPAVLDLDDGSRRPVLVRATALHDLDNRVEHVLVTFEDRTELDQELTMCRAAAERARAVLDHVAAAVVVHGADGTVRDLNAGARRLFGRQAATLVGERSFPLTWRPMLDDGTPLSTGDHPAARALRTGGTIERSVIGIVPPDVPQPRWLTASASPLFDPASLSPVAVVVSYTDVTDLRSEQRRLVWQLDELVHMLSNLPLAVYRADAALVPIEVNQGWIDLHGDDHDRDADLRLLTHPDDRDELDTAVNAAVTNGSILDHRHRVRRPSGAIQWVHHRASPITDNDGRLTGFVGVMVPVPEHVGRHDEIHRLARIAEEANDLLGAIDVADLSVSYLNRRAMRIFAPGVRRPQDVELAAIYTPRAVQRFVSDIWPQIESGEAWEGDLGMVTADGEVQVFQRITGEHDTAGNLVRIWSVGHDVTERHRREVELSLRATHDVLTGLPNRLMLLEKLDLALSRAWRSGRLVALLFLDLDRFKTVNDRRGHDAGDEVLVQLADRLVEVVRPGDTVARIGGDEFVILCDGVETSDEALVIANRVASAIASHDFLVGGQDQKMSASIGIALSSGTDHPEALLRDSDAAMYRAKDLGRARLELFDEGMRRQATTRVQLADELGDALRLGEISVHYQPSIDLRKTDREDGVVEAVEALARWEHPVRGMLHPSDFIGVADDTGLVLGLGTDVLRQACRKVREWQARYGRRAPRVHVNLSTRQLAQTDVCRVVEEVLAETGTDPSMLCLELTESVLMDDSDTTLSTLERLKAIGVQLAIDDFGTGYSSLSYLGRLPIDVVKIDKSFIEGLERGSDNRAVVAAIINLAHTLGLRVVAEGVTTVTELGQLHDLKCDAAQGFYFAAPLPEREIELYLDRRLRDPE
ncbi:MAG: EAL domain-containing protein [Actinomycetota bacterium]|nr:EAL domain-containing protein [Actinomycetota bacterium]